MFHEVHEEFNIVGQRAIVIGAGIAGLSAARALSDYFEQVVVLEADDLPTTPVPRKGVPQGKQVHGLLGGAIKGIKELFPGIEQDLIEAGAIPVRNGWDLELEFPVPGPLPRRDLGLLIYALSRPLLEFIIRRRLQQQKNVTLRMRSRVLELVGESDGAWVSGVRFRTVSGEIETLSADLVVDASAQATPTLSFLKATGRQPPEQTTIGVDIRYATAIFEDIEKKSPANALGVVTFPNAPESARSGYLFPIEGNRMHLLLTGRGADAPSADVDEYLEYAKGLATCSIYDTIKDAKLLGNVERYNFPESTWRHFGGLGDFPRRLIPVGDAVCRFNPVYGQGMTVAIMEANLLRRLLQCAAQEVDPLSGLGQAFVTEVEQLIEDPWNISAVPDFIYPQTRGERPSNLEEMIKFQGALYRIAAEDPAVHKLLFEVLQLLKPRSVLQEPELVSRIEEILKADAETVAA
jgi:2-polyprenyl-6-methoxyphenol hydroxylase-like FAD-dependent oxidoreductase